MYHIAIKCGENHVKEKSRKGEAYVFFRRIFSP
jgi:hypothetical protein